MDTALHNSQKEALENAIAAAGAEGFHTSRLREFALSPRSRLTEIYADNVVVRVQDPKSRFKYLYLIRKKTLADRQREAREEKVRQEKQLERATVITDWKGLEGPQEVEILKHGSRYAISTKRGTFWLPDGQTEMRF